MVNYLFDIMVHCQVYGVVSESDQFAYPMQEYSRILNWSTELRNDLRDIPLLLNEPSANCIPWIRTVCVSLAKGSLRTTPQLSESEYLCKVSNRKDLHSPWRWLWKYCIFLASWYNEVNTDSRFYENKLHTELYFVSSNGVRGGRVSLPPDSSSWSSVTSSIFELSDAIALVVGSRNICLELGFKVLRDALVAANKNASGTAREGWS